MSGWVQPPVWVGPRAEEAFNRLATDRGLRRLRGLVWALLAVGVLGFLVEGANTVPRPVLSNTPLPGATIPR
ncbi:MAG TPA: hypothetical protein VE990_00605 [Acidimicrobiales bacterium]|nr:hypothetical protein [Acidimicrobiales bacterium]